MARVNPCFLDRVCLFIFRRLKFTLKIFAARGRVLFATVGMYSTFTVGWPFALVPAGCKDRSVLRALAYFAGVAACYPFAPRLRPRREVSSRGCPAWASVFLLMLRLFLYRFWFDSRDKAVQHSTFPWNGFGSLPARPIACSRSYAGKAGDGHSVRPVMKCTLMRGCFFVPLFWSRPFAVVNLLVGLIVNSMAGCA